MICVIEHFVTSGECAKDAVLEILLVLMLMRTRGAIDLMGIIIDPEMHFKVQLGQITYKRQNVKIHFSLCMLLLSPSCQTMAFLTFICI